MFSGNSKKEKSQSKITLCNNWLYLAHGVYDIETLCEIENAVYNTELSKQSNSFAWVGVSKTPNTSIGFK